jgi:protein-tyrosine-phosphatase
MLPRPVVEPVTRHADITFVCSHNSARSQFAAALWTSRTGEPASSAGAEPAAVVHPTAVRVATEFGVDLSGMSPHGYDTLPDRRDLIVSVCDRANEGGLPRSQRHLHWSIPDPVAAGGIEAFRAAFAEIALRTEQFALSGGE